MDVGLRPLCHDPQIRRDPFGGRASQDGGRRTLFRRCDLLSSRPAAKKEAAPSWRDPPHGLCASAPAQFPLDGLRDPGQRRKRSAPRDLGLSQMALRSFALAPHASPPRGQRRRRQGRVPRDRAARARDDAGLRYSLGRRPGRAAGGAFRGACLDL